MRRLVRFATASARATGVERSIAPGPDTAMRKRIAGAAARASSLRVDDPRFDVLERHAREPRTHVAGLDSGTSAGTGSTIGKPSSASQP